MRVCQRGHELKPENTYVRPNGKRRCKTCKQASARTYYQRNLEKLTVYKREYYQRNPEKRRAYARAYYKQHRQERLEKDKAYSRAYYEKHREERLVYAKQHKRELKSAAVSNQDFISTPAARCESGHP